MDKIRSKIVRMTSSQTKSMSRSISLICRGEPIQREQLFEYTNGRFLVNEKYERSKRYAKFDLDALCTMVSSLPSISSPIYKIEKMEGGSNKALLMTAENGVRYKDWHKLKSYTQELLYSDDDGWAPPQFDFDMVKARHAELFQLYIQKETEELSEEEAKKLWTYIDREQ